MEQANHSTPNFSHQVIVGAPHLLNMLYTPAELAEELRVPARTIHDWTQFDMPHCKDTSGRLWIHGLEFAAWVTRIRAQRRKTELRPGEAYCGECKKAVVIQGADPSTLGRVVVLMGRCPWCGTVVHRGMAGDPSG